MTRWARRIALALALAAALVAVLATLPSRHVATSQAAGSHATAATSLPPIKHVWIIVEENKDGAEWELLGQRYAPYLATTLVGDGALLSNYYGTGHASADNYISMISGQPPTYDSKDDCPDMSTLPSTENSMGIADTTAQGCTYPDNFLTIADELNSAGMTWKAYQEGIPGPCSLASSNGQYQRKHNPFVFFESLREDGQCAANDVGLDQLSTDLQSESTTPNYSFITPNECDDGHSDCISPSSEGLQTETDELTQTDTFLKTWVPQIMASPAYKDNGLIAIIWDESDTDITSCCGEVMNDPDGSTAGGEDSSSSPGSQYLPGAGGGVTGAVFLSPFIKPGTTSSVDYNHYSFLKTLESLWGLPLLGYAQTSGLTPMGSDVFTNWTGTTTSTTPTTSSTGTSTTSGPSLPTGTATAIARCESRQPLITTEHEKHRAGSIFLHGTAFEFRCADNVRLSAITRVQVAMALRVGARCRWVNANGSIGAVAACADPVIHTAHGGRSWQLTLKVKRRRGSYLVIARALDGHTKLSSWRHLDFPEY